MFIANRLRRMNWYDKFQIVANRKSHRSGQWPDKWNFLTDSWKQKFLEFWAHHPESKCVREQIDWALANFVTGQLEAKKESRAAKQRSRVKQVLLTYNGK